MPSIIEPKLCKLVHHSCYCIPLHLRVSFSFSFVGTMMIYDYEETLIQIEKGRVDIERIGATSRYSLVTIV